MRLDGGNPDAANRILYGDGNGNFIPTLVSTGIGNHESTVGDLDNDGDLDILGKLINWDTPRLDLWVNQRAQGCPAGPNWQRQVIDADRPWGALLSPQLIWMAMESRTSLRWLVVSESWQQRWAWTRHTMGASLNNMALVYDFDNDGDMDVIGTGGKGAKTNAAFVWGRDGRHR